MVRFDDNGELGLDPMNDEAAAKELEELRVAEKEARQEVKMFRCRSDEPDSRIM